MTIWIRRAAPSWNAVISLKFLISREIADPKNDSNKNSSRAEKAYP